MKGSYEEKSNGELEGNPNETKHDQVDNMVEQEGRTRIVGFVALTAEGIAVSRNMSAHPLRSALIHSLIRALGILERPGVTLVDARTATASDLKRFHSSEYIDFLRHARPEITIGGEADYGLEHDAPVFEGLWRYVCIVTGAALTAAEFVISEWEAGRRAVGVCLDGGRHHARRNQAAGFCYVNDCVLVIMTLGRVFDRVLYVDLDVHHGDGVEQAFYLSDAVLTISFHKYAPGFYPGSGRPEEVGAGRGMYCNLNVAIEDGADDETYVAMVSAVVAAAQAAFEPEAVVVQCGVDTLAHDPLGCMNLTERGVTDCIRTVDALGLPTVVLGGGGYAEPDAARSYAAVVAALVGAEVPERVPEHEWFEAYGPAFCTRITRSQRPNRNTPASIAASIASATSALARLRAARSCSPL